MILYADAFLFNINIHVLYVPNEQMKFQLPGT